MCYIKSIICQRLEKSVTCAAFLERKKLKGIGLCYYIKAPFSRIGYVYVAIKAHAPFKLQRNQGSGGREVEKL